MKKPDIAARDEIYNRFILALIRLKRINKKNDDGLAEVTEDMFGQRLSRVKLIHQVLTDDMLLVHLTAMTAILEISHTWREFKSLRHRQQQGERALMNPDNDRYIVDFERWILAKSWEAFSN